MNDSRSQRSRNRDLRVPDRSGQQQLVPVLNNGFPISKQFLCRARRRIDRTRTVAALIALFVASRVPVSRAHARRTFHIP
jgi:hypothetical protein